MAKLSQIKLGNTTYDIGAAWGNVSGKPSTFPPESHTHSYLPLSGGTLTGTVNSSGNMNLYGSNAYFSLGTSSSSSKCYFQTYNATTAGADDANLKAGFGFGWSNSLIIDKSGNVTIPGDLIVSGGDITGNAATATKLTTDAGGTTTPVYFSGGAPKACTIIKSGAWHGGLTYIGGDGVMEVGRYIDFHVDKTGTSDYDVRITASTTGLSIGGTTSGTFKGNLDGNASSATKATQDGSGNVITSKYVTLDTAQTISGTKTMTSSLKVSGRYVGGGDDEGIIVGFANNGYAGLCLGGPSEARSVFYFKSDGSSPFWRYNNGSASYDILHPSKNGTIALTSDLSGYLPLSGGTLTGLLNAHGGISLNSSTAQASGAPEYILGIKAFAEGGNIIWQSRANVSVGYADSAGTCTSLSTNAGSTTKAIYFSGGKPAQCNDTINHNISGNANTASLWALTGTANTTTGHSDWDGGVGNTNKYTVYDQEWACSAIGSDTGDLRVFLRPGEYSSGGTEVCFAIDGDYYVMGNKVLHAGNYTNYAAQKSHTHTISQVTWGAGENLICTGDSSEWSVDMQSSAPNSYFHIWSGYLGNSCMTFSNKTGQCHAPYGVSGAVWNDYAEYRNQLEEIEPGYCVTANDKGEVFKTSFRLQACDGVVSDTFGFSIGETEKAKTPLAVAGRVLVYCGDERSIYHFGDCVCAGPNGLAYKMTEEEIQKYPHRIIGTVSEIPDYEIWGTGNVPVNNRIWIKVK